MGKGLGVLVTLQILRAKRTDGSLSGVSLVMGLTKATFSPRR